jgi:hypothetical protein
MMYALAHGFWFGLKACLEYSVDSVKGDGRQAPGQQIKTSGLSLSECQQT